MTEKSEEWHSAVIQRGLPQLRLLFKLVGSKSGFTFIHVYHPDCSSHQQGDLHCRVLHALRLCRLPSVAGSVLYFLKVMLQRGERKEEREPECPLGAELVFTISC